MPTRIASGCGIVGGGKGRGAVPVEHSSTESSHEGRSGAGENEISYWVKRRGTKGERIGRFVRR